MFLNLNRRTRWALVYGRSGLVLGLGLLWGICPVGVRPVLAIDVPVLESGVEHLENLELQKALALLNQGKREDATRLVAHHLEAHSNSVPALELKAVILVQDGRVDDGLQTLLQAVALDPSQATAWTKIGDIHRSRGDLAAAKSCFQRALAASPNDRHANQRLGLLLEEEGEVTSAIEHFEKGLLGTSPDYVGVKVNLGSLYNRTGQYRRTVDLLRPVMGDGVAHPVGHLTYGAALLALGNSLEALQAFERAKRAATEPAQTAMALGIAYRNVGKLEESLAEFRLLLEEKPDRADARFQMAETLVALKRIPEAMTAFERASADPATAPIAMLRQAQVLADARRPAEALERLDQISRSGKGSPRSELLRAQILERSERYEEAGRVLAAAVGAYPQNAEVRLRHGLHLGAVGKYADAVAELERASGLAPAEPRAWKALALAWYRQRDWTKAERAARKLLELIPRSPGDRFFLGSILESAGKDAEAQEAYEQVLAVQPQDVATLNNLAMVLARRKEFPRAIEVAGRATTLAPGEAVVWDTLGWVQAQADQIPQARASLARAVSLPQARPQHRYHYAVVLERAGEPALALDEVERALKSEEFSGRDAAEALRTRLRSAKPR